MSDAKEIERSSDALVEWFGRGATLVSASDSELWRPGREGSFVYAAPRLTAALGELPEIASRLSSGDLLRVVGPPDVVAQLKAGSLELMRTSTGDLAIARNKDGIVAPLRVESASSGLSTAAATIFQLASAVTLQYYLHAIAVQGESISRSLADLQHRLQAGLVGELTPAFDALARARTAMSEGRDVDDVTVYRDNSMKVLGTIHDLFRTRATDVEACYRTVEHNAGRARVNPRLKRHFQRIVHDADTAWRKDAGTAIAAASVYIGLTEAALYRGDLDRRTARDDVDRATQRVGTVSGTMNLVVAGIRPDQVDDAFRYQTLRVLGRSAKPVQVLGELEERSDDLRSALARLSELELPAHEAPWVLEARVVPGRGLQARVMGAQVAA